MNAKSKTNLIVKSSWQGLSAVLILTCVTSVFAQTPTLRANGKIAFTSDRDGNREIYVMNPDGTNQLRLTNNQVVDDHPTWSPDGTKIAFVSEKTSGGFAIFVMNADGTNKVEVTPLILNATASIWDGWGMSWSPDGNRIVFQQIVEPSTTPFHLNDIYLVNIDGSNRKLLVGSPSDERQPAWSPDGFRILFSRSTSSTPRFHHNLFTIRPDGTDLQALANNPEETDLAPTWSPAGDRIAFVNFDFTNGENIAISNADGSSRFWFDAGDISGPDLGNRDKPDWSPDGSKIVFHVFLDRGGTQIYVKNVDGTGLTRLTDQPGNNFKPSWQSLAPAACPNPSDCADSFVRQHYLDFLNREPDPEGLAFWTNEITSCGSDPQCVEVKRINVSAAFFLSIEFQETGYFVHRLHKVAYGNIPGTPVPVRREEFLTDAQQIGFGVQVGVGNWEQQIDANKNAYASTFVSRARFTNAYPAGTDSGAFVDQLNANAGGALSREERDNLVNALAGGSMSRAQVLRAVAEDADFAQGPEKNSAFVLAQYFGYLRRNPDDVGFNGQPDPNFDGYNFWLNKLNQFNGNFIEAEMVRAFITSIEYRRRFE